MIISFQLARLLFSSLRCNLNCNWRRWEKDQRWNGLFLKRLPQKIKNKVLNRALGVTIFAMKALRPIFALKWPLFQAIIAIKWKKVWNTVFGVIWKIWFVPLPASLPHHLPHNQVEDGGGNLPHYQLSVVGQLAPDPNVRLWGAILTSLLKSSVCIPRRTFLSH